MKTLLRFPFNGLLRDHSGVSPHLWSLHLLRKHSHSQVCGKWSRDPKCPPLCEWRRNDICPCLLLLLLFFPAQCIVLGLKASASGSQTVAVYGTCALLGSFFWVSLHWSSETIREMGMYVRSRPAICQFWQIDRLKSVVEAEGVLRGCWVCHVSCELEAPQPPSPWSTWTILRPTLPFHFVPHHLSARWLRCESSPLCAAE